MQSDADGRQPAARRPRRKRGGAGAGAAPRQSASPDVHPGGSRLARLAVPAVVLGTTALLYAFTLYPGVGGRVNVGDSAKFQYGGKILGVPHDPGYPQYMVLNHLWTRLPLPGELAVRVNTLSAALSLLAGALLYATFRRLSGSRAAAALGTWGVLLSPAVWTFSTEAEVYSLHLLWTAAVLWTGERWWARRSEGWLLGLLAALAFSFGNHPLAVTLVPAVAVLVLAAGARWVLAPRVVAVAAVLVALSAAQYSYVLWRSNSDVVLVEAVGPDAGLAELARSMLGSRFAGNRLLRLGWAGTADRMAEVGVQSLDQLGLPLLLAAALGAFLLVRRDRALVAFVALPGLGAGLFAAAYHIGDWQGYVAPTWVSLAALASVGAGSWTGLSPSSPTEAPHRHPTRPRTARSVASLLAAALLIAWAASLGIATVAHFEELRVEESPYDLGPLLQAAEPGSMVVDLMGNGYREFEVYRYYEHGLDLEDRDGVEVGLGRDLFAGEWLFLQDGPLLLDDRRIRDELVAHRTDHERRLVGDEPPPYRYWITSTSSPVRAVELTPAASGIEARLRGEPFIAPGAPIQALVVAATDRRVKGVVEFGWTDRLRDGTHPVLDMAYGIRPDDWYCVVIQGVELPFNQRLVRSIAEILGSRVPLQALASASVVVLVGRKSRPAEQLVAIDPEAPFEVVLEES